jgi:ribosomal protein S30
MDIVQVQFNYKVSQMSKKHGSLAKAGKVVVALSRSERPPRRSRRSPQKRVFLRLEEPD